MTKLKRKTLKKVSKQLAKASKMHAGQSKKIGKLANMMKDGGYPKSDKNDFMKRMGYYQGGGLATPPMYGANTIPGSQETAAITYTEADPAKLKALEEQLKETQESTQYMDEAEANIAKQQGTINSIEQGVGTVGKALTGDELKNEAGETLGDRLGLDKILQTGPDRFLSQTERATKALQAGKTDKFLRIADRANKGVDKFTNVGQDALSKGLSLTQTPASSGLNFATQLTPPPSILPTGSLPSSLTNFSAPTLTTTPMSSLSLTTPGASKLSQAALSSGTSASKGLIGSVGPGGVGAIASIAGEGIKMASDDQDATTMNTGETIGSGLSGVGTGIGAAMTTAALLGSSLGPLGTAAGAIGGAVYGLGKGLIQRGKARKEIAKAEKKQERDENKLATAQKLEALKSRMYSGYDMGSDLRQSGGFSKKLDALQDSLTVAGVFPALGAVPDLINTGISGGRAAYNYAKGNTAAAKSNLANAGVSLVSAVPVYGDALSVPKVASTAIKYGSKVKKGKAAARLAEPLVSQPMMPSTDVNQTFAAETTGVRPPIIPQPIVTPNVPTKQYQPLPPGGFGSLLNKKQMGGVKLPGGVAKPIPGSDAIEFKGKSHAQGGIMVDPNTEVEGNETMDKVTMKNGGKSDYFFSQHLKLGGKSFAQRHKDILKNGGSQKDIDALAKVQEKKAGRNPGDVKLGAGGYYQGGGEFLNYTQTSYNNDVNQDGIDDFTQGVTTRTQYYPGTTIPIEQPPVVEDETPTTPATTPTTSNTSGGSSPKSEERENVELARIDPIQVTQIPVNNTPAPGTYVDLQGNTVTPQMGPEEFDYDSLSQADKNVIDKANSDQELTDLEKKALKRLNRDVPGLAIAAGAAQLIAPAYAFFKKDRVAEQMGAPGRIKAPTLDRVSYNAERASNAAQNRAISRSIENSGIGPAGIIAKMSSYRRKQEGDIKIAAAESRANTAIANQEAQMAQQANVRNVANAMQADQINTQLRERQLAANEDRRLGAIDSFTERTAGLAGDLLSYKATERLARATGDMGIYERDRLRNFLKNQINPRTGQPYTNADIAELFNKRFGEAQATKEDKKDE